MVAFPVKIDWAGRACTTSARRCGQRRWRGCCRPISSPAFKTTPSGKTPRNSRPRCGWC